MSEPAPGSELRRHRRDHVLAAVEGVEGVVAASVGFTHDGQLEAVRVVALPSAEAERLRRDVSATLGEHGFRFDAHLIEVARMSAAAPQAARPQTEDRGPRSRNQGSADTPARTRLTETNAPTGAAAEGDADNRRAFAPQKSTTEEDEAGSRREPDRPRLQLVEDESPPPPWHGRFLVLEGVDVQRRQNRVTCRVRITRLGETLSGEAEDLDSPAARARCAARAALVAAQQAGEGVELSLEGVQIHDFMGREYVIAFVDASANRRWTSLSGIVAVDNSVETAAVLAILRAVERWVAW